MGPKQEENKRREGREKEEKVEASPRPLPEFCWTTVGVLPDHRRSFARPLPEALAFTRPSPKALSFAGPSPEALNFARPSPEAVTFAGPPL